jgi:hypothetical protein
MFGLRRDAPLNSTKAGVAPSVRTVIEVLSFAPDRRIAKPAALSPADPPSRTNAKRATLPS